LIIKIKAMGLEKIKPEEISLEGQEELGMLEKEVASKIRKMLNTNAKLLKELISDNDLAIGFKRKEAEKLHGIRREVYNVSKELDKDAGAEAGFKKSA